VITFSRELTLHVGDHTFRMIHMPGHTTSQAAVVVENDGVVFTSDNVFCQCHTWLQEADPAAWLKTLDGLRALAAETLVPGHGPVCDKGYLREQGAFIEEWVDYVRRGVDKGLAKDEAVATLKMNVANLYDYVTGAGMHRRA
jgi:cyclase